MIFFQDLRRYFFRFYAHGYPATDEQVLQPVYRLVLSRHSVSVVSFRVRISRVLSIIRADRSIGLRFALPIDDIAHPVDFPWVERVARQSWQGMCLVKETSPPALMAGGRLIATRRQAKPE